MIERFSALRISTRQLIKARSGVGDDRGELQAAGEQLDRETHGRWLADDVAKMVEGLDTDAVVVIDSVRVARQIDHLRTLFRDRMLHVHVTADLEILTERYASRDGEVNEFATYAEAKVSPTEAAIGDLGLIADVVVDSGRFDADGMIAYALTDTGLLPDAPEPLVDVIVGGQLGSEGKGNVCAHLAQNYDVLMRVGGPNAGHKVEDPKYTYIQLPSGTGSNSKARILVGPGATISLPQMLKEICELGLTPERLSIDPQAMMIEAQDVAEEEETLDVIGSTKKGVGVATARKILGRNGKAPFGSETRLARDVEELEPYVRSTRIELERAYAARERIMLEGTQGTDLSLHHGKYPYVTSRETSAAGCLADAGISPLRVRRVVMVTRTYPIRVGGNSGPIFRPIDFGTVAARSGLPEDEIRATEVGTVSGKVRRIGEFDWDQVRRAAVLNGATDIALTFADYISSENRKASRFEQLTEETRTFIAAVERVTKASVSLIAVSNRKVIDRRSWR